METNPASASDSATLSAVSGRNIALIIFISFFLIVQSLLARALAIAHFLLVPAQ
jgi:hypothetical protein